MMSTPGAAASDDHLAPSPDSNSHAPPPTSVLNPLSIAIAILLVLAFAPYLAWMGRIWMKSPYYGHGPIIPLLSGWIIYTRRHDFFAAREEGRNAWGVPIVLVCLGMHTWATVRDVNFPQGFAMIGVIAGLALLLWGWERAKILAFPIAFLSFMVPVGRLLVTKLSNPMQIGSAAIAARVPMLLGVPTQVQGTTIVIPDYTFEVAQACSGLKSIIAMTALAALFAYLVVAPMYKRVILLAAAIPVALAANTCRIALTLLLGRSFGSAAAEGFFHSLSGIMVFLLGMTGLLLIAKALKCEAMREDIM